MVIDAILIVLMLSNLGMTGYVIYHIYHKVVPIYRPISFDAAPKEKFKPKYKKKPL
jgi:hypothetical protein